MTINQLIKKNRKKKIKKNLIKALKKCPQKRGICFKIMTMKPKKPNSARRKIVRVNLFTGYKIHVFIPGEGHNLVMYALILIRGGRLQDVPGVRYKAIRNKFDLQAILLRENARSKYGKKRLIKKITFKLRNIRY
jgi:small subunit ribosomal protein S12